MESKSSYSVSTNLENVLYHQRNDQYRQRNNDQDDNDQTNYILIRNVVGKKIEIKNQRVTYNVNNINDSKSSKSRKHGKRRKQRKNRKQEQHLSDIH